MTNYEHFETNVNRALCEKMSIIAKNVADDFICDRQKIGGETYGDSMIEPIYGIALSGYIPFQKGGYEVTAFCQQGTDSSLHITKKQGEFLEKLFENFCTDFAKENNLPEDFKNCELSDELQDVFCEAENELFVPALLRFELWIDDKQTEEAIVYYRLSLGYGDSPYYRSRYDETIFEGNLSVSSFMTTPPAGFVKMLVDKMQSFQKTKVQS